MRKFILLNTKHNLAVSSTSSHDIEDFDPCIDLSRIKFYINDIQYSFYELKEKYITIFSPSAENIAFAVLSPEVRITEEKNNIKWIPVQKVKSTNLEIYNQYIRDVLQGYVPHDTKFEVWSFGDNERLANELLALVLEEKKTGTSSSLWSYEFYKENIPEIGEISIITNWAGIPKCIIETTKIEIIEFKKVTEEFAKSEGEGDLSLEYWRKGHWIYFQRESKITGKLPKEDMPLVCENFRVIYIFNKNNFLC